MVAQASRLCLRRLNDHDPIRATPNNESLCRGGFKTRPYTLTLTVKTAATKALMTRNSLEFFCGFDKTGGNPAPAVRIPSYH